MYFAGGVLASGVICLVVLRLGGLTIASQDELGDQAQLIADLQQDNLELSSDLFRFQGPNAVFNNTDLPYDETADARAQVADGREKALEEGKFLMITFGANWCVDCRTLYRNLRSDDVSRFTDGVFHFVNVDIGKFNNNNDVAVDLGVDLSRGIPVAVFFNPAGEKIGTTNDGQLETARLYTSKQILKFVRDVAERSLIVAPDSVH
jgi:thioredoxin 1